MEEDMNWFRFNGAKGASLAAAAALCIAPMTMAARAADLPTLKAPAPAAEDDTQLFFIKLGFTYVWNVTSSNLSGQSPTALAHGNPTVYPSGVGATIGDVPTLGVEGGIYLSRHVSLNVAGGIPYFVKDKTVGYNPLNPVLKNGTVLTRFVPGLIPITLNYHFDPIGPIRPYIGAGVAPGFAFTAKDAFLYNNHVGSSLGVTIAAGADYMFDRNWGVGLDVKKTFAHVHSYADGMNIPGVGKVPAKVYQSTFFEPWTFSLALIYRFGGNGVPFR
jgi:outer membrane protein